MIEEEDSLFGAPKRRQLFTDIDTKQIYQIKNQVSTSQAILSYHSQIKLDESFTREGLPDTNNDANNDTIIFKETLSENVNIKEISQPTNDAQLRESTLKKDARIEDSIFVKPLSDSNGNLLCAGKDYKINVSQTHYKEEQDKQLQEHQVEVELQADDEDENDDKSYTQKSKYLKGTNQILTSPNKGYKRHKTISQVKGKQQEDEQEVDIVSQKNSKFAQKQTFQEIWCRLGSVLFNVKKFLRVLKSKSSYFKFKVLMDHHSLHIIGDKSSYYNNDLVNYRESNQLKYIESNCLVKFSEPFSPDEAAVLIWETFLVAIIIMEMFVIPFRTCFKMNLSDMNQLFITIPMISYIIEIAFNMNMGYFDQGNLIVDRKLIIKSYLKKQFIVDIICLVTSLFQQDFIEFQAIGFFSLIVRVSKVQRLCSRLDDSYQLQFKYPEANELFRLMMTIIFIAHVTGCGFHYVGMFISSEQNSWIKRIEIYHSSTFDSLYYAFITMVTVGYGDIVPVSKVEKIYVIFMTLVSCGVFAYAVNTIGVIFRDLSKKQFDFKRVLRALEYAEQQEQRGNQKGELILKKVQNHLQNEIKQDFFGKILLNHKVFQLNFSNSFLNQLSLKMNEKLLARDDILFQSDDIDENYYIILSGSLEINALTLQSVTLETLLPGTGIGQRGFFSGNSRCLQARCSEITRVVYLSRTTFLETVKNFPEDFERFCYIKDQILLEGKEFDIKCFACKQFAHTILDCPVINPKPDLKNDITFSLLYHKFEISERKKVERKVLKKSKIFQELQNVRMQLKSLRFNLCSTEVQNDIFNKFKRGEEDNEESDEEMYNRLNDFEFYMRYLSLIKVTYFSHIIYHQRYHLLIQQYLFSIFYQILNKQNNVFAESRELFIFFQVQRKNHICKAQFFGLISILMQFQEINLIVIYYNFNCLNNSLIKINKNSMPQIKMIKCSYDDKIYDIVVEDKEDDNKKMIEDIPLLEHVQDYLKQSELYSQMNDRNTDLNSEFATNQLILNEPSIANENNCGNINYTTNNSLIGFNGRSISNQIIEPQTYQFIQNPPQGIIKKQKSQIQQNATRNNNNTNSVSIEFDLETIKEQQANQAQASTHTEIYFKQLENKQNLSPLEQEVLKTYHSQNMLNQSYNQNNISLDNKDSSITTKQSNNVCTEQTSQPLQYAKNNSLETNDFHKYELGESPKLPKKQGIMSQVPLQSLQTVKTMMTNQFGDCSSVTTNSNQNQQSDKLKKKRTKTVTIISNDTILHHLTKLNSSAYSNHNQNNNQTNNNLNNSSDKNSNEYNEIINSIKVHHQMKGSSDQPNKITTQNPINNSRVNKHEQINSSRQLGFSHHQISQNQGRSRMSNYLSIEDVANIAQVRLNKEKSKTSNEEKCWSIQDFEVLKSFKRYYPQNNSEQVIKRFRLNQERRQRIKNQQNKFIQNKFFQNIRQIPNSPANMSRKICQSIQIRRNGMEKTLLQQIYNNISIGQLKQSGGLNLERRKSIKNMENSCFQSRTKKTSGGQLQQSSLDSKINEIMQDTSIRDDQKFVD